jgi:predicted metal-dependent phosphoesterase TrpH
MPAGQPFTNLCQVTVRGRQHGRSDLHLHTTYSDGLYTPQQLVDLARRTGLAAIAVTDHDTLDGVAPARAAAAGTGMEIIAGVEITASYSGREVHLLAYFVDGDDGALARALSDLRRARSERFLAMVERLRRCGVSIEPGPLPPAPGRRHLAEMLVHAGKVGSVREAFSRFLRDGGPADAPKRCLPAEEALALVRRAGGVAGRAHPSYHSWRDDLAAMQTLGLRAVEVEYPGVKRHFARQLRDWAADRGLAVTGGSDCHGPGGHAPGSWSVSAAELAALRLMAGGS